MSTVSVHCFEDLFVNLVAKDLFGSLQYLGRGADLAFCWLLNIGSLDLETDSLPGALLKSKPSFLKFLLTMCHLSRPGNITMKKKYQRTLCVCYARCMSTPWYNARTGLACWRNFRCQPFGAECDNMKILPHFATQICSLTIAIVIVSIFLNNICLLILCMSAFVCLFSNWDFHYWPSHNLIKRNKTSFFFQRELRAAYGLIDCLLNGLQPSEKTALFGDLVSVEYFYLIQRS